MSTTTLIRAFFFFLFILHLMVCFYSTFGKTLSYNNNNNNNNNNTMIPSNSSSPSSNISDFLNIVAISIVNDLPPQSGSLIFTAIDFSSPVSLEPGKPFVQVTNTQVKFAYFQLDPFDPKCCSIARYDPKVDAGHRDVFWSVRKDGPYHSWDNRNWRRTTTWGKC
ncbi:hypothetical protein HN873_066932 [Arachis hypogaea]|uniref:Leguminosin group486 secreted peptide n=1 Tax=Arachis hypogaea TaxID=3818 RepID=A0A6B9V7Y5_ARAHY|nr:uncharacterized protein DS421_19g651870 [Arachis hypogaea]